MEDDDATGIEFGDLPDILDQVAREHKAADTDAPLLWEYGGYCGHGKASINEHLRKLTCRECSAQLDPFDFLLRLSRDTSRWITARKSAEVRAREASARLSELLRQERNVRARLARLTKREQA